MGPGVFSMSFGGPMGQGMQFQSFSTGPRQRRRNQQYREGSDDGEETKSGGEL